MIVAYVKNTGNKVLACAEMTYQVEMAKEVLVDPLPAEVKKNVVWRDTYWLPDEAASVYAKAQAVVSVECHSPLIALHNGTPAFYVRQPTDTCKGQMYRDFGANDWFFEVDETSGDQLWSRLQAIVRDPAKAKAKVKSIMATVEARQKRMVDAVRAACRIGSPLTRPSPARADRLTMRRYAASHGNSEWKSQVLSGERLRVEETQSPVAARRLRHCDRRARRAAIEFAGDLNETQGLSQDIRRGGACPHPGGTSCSAPQHHRHLRGRPRFRRNRLL